MGTENRHSKHNKKRKMIQISLYSKDQAIMKSKYGMLLNATQAKDILLIGEYTQRIVEINKTPLNSDVHNQLIRIGNNINQLAYVANARNETPQEALLLRELRDLKELVKLIRNLL